MIQVSLVIDRLIDFNKCLQGIPPSGEDSGGLGQTSVMIRLRSSGSPSSRCPHRVGGKIEEKTHLESLDFTNLRSDSGINQGGSVLALYFTICLLCFSFQCII